MDVEQKTLLAESVAPSQKSAARPTAKLRRAMVPAELMGAHIHPTIVGVNVYIFMRDGKYIARGRHQKRMFGPTLGADVREASRRLRHLLTEIEKGTFVRPTEARCRNLRTDPVPQFQLRELCDAFVTETRKLRGMNTAHDYLHRLLPALAFAEEPKVQRRWPLAIDLDANRDFAIELRAFLFKYLVTPNGRPGASPRPMSGRQVHNVLSTLRSALAWAKRPEVHRLPIGFVNPLTPEIVGPKPAKDPLRPNKVPLKRRIALVEIMEPWQLCHLALLLVLPLRPDEATALLISDVDFSGRILHFQTRLGGRDFNKARRSFVLPFPQILVPLLKACIGNRVEGPLFRSRSVFEGRVQPRYNVNSLSEIEGVFNEQLIAAGDDVQSEQDAKELFRRLLHGLGGVTGDELAKEYKQLVWALGWKEKSKLYDLRGAVHTDMNAAGVSILAMKYMTGRALKDILFEYTSIDPREEMRRYFQRIEPLLLAIRKRAAEVLKAHTMQIG